MYARIWNHRSLLTSFAYRQYQLRYRQSVVGFVWALIPALATLAAGTLVFHKVANVQTGGVPYAVFSLAAIAPWTFFSSALNTGVPSIATSQSMVSRLPFPRAILPLSMMVVSLLDLAVAMLTFVTVALLTHTGIPLTFLWSPVLLVIEMALLVGVTLWASAVNVFARDVKLGVPVLVQLWLLITPVMYPLSAVPRDVRGLYLANPMTGLIESFRRVLVFGHAPQLRLLLPSLIGAVVTMVVGSWYFAATESRFADVL